MIYLGLCVATTAVELVQRHRETMDHFFIQSQWHWHAYPLVELGANRRPLMHPRRSSPGFALFSLRADPCTRGTAASAPPLEKEWSTKNSRRDRHDIHVLPSDRHNRGMRAVYWTRARTGHSFSSMLRQRLTDYRSLLHRLPIQVARQGRPNR